MTRPAFVQSTFDFAIREINALEGRIVQAEDNADAMLWEQAGQVVAQLEGGLSLRKLAAQWINARTGEPYNHTHVYFVAQVFSQLNSAVPRPRFRDAYNEIANAPRDPHVSQNTGNNEWYTPTEYIEAARAVLGGIDLDPASSAEADTIVKASTYYTLEQNGLAQPWRGRVWLNPPYAQPLIEQFCDKLCAEVRAGHVTAAVVLVNNATETQWFQTLGDVASAICLPTARVRFWSPDGTAAMPLQGQVVLYVGNNIAAFEQAFATFGTCGVVWVKSE